MKSSLCLHVSGGALTFPKPSSKQAEGHLRCVKLLLATYGAFAAEPRLQGLWMWTSHPVIATIRDKSNCLTVLGSSYIPIMPLLEGGGSTYIVETASLLCLDNPGIAMKLLWCLQFLLKTSGEERRRCCDLGKRRFRRQAA